jgi:REP-associated tyrosine transposase
MVSFLNLRDAGGFALTPRETDLCGAVRWHAGLLRGVRGATVAPFLIASGQLLEIELTRSEQRRKNFLIASFSGDLRGTSNSPIGRLAFPGVRGSRITGRESRFTNCASRFTRHHPNQSLAKHNRKPTQMIENKQQRSKSIASFCRAFLGSKGNGAQSRKAGFQHESSRKAIDKTKRKSTGRIACATTATREWDRDCPPAAGAALCRPYRVSVVMRIAAGRVLMLKRWSLAYYHRTLPHWLPEGHAVFLTWRLHGSLPVCIQRELRAEKRVEAGEEFTRIDKQLDRAEAGPLWLNDTRVADCVSCCLELGDFKYRHYDLHSFVVMANHVHVLLSPRITLRCITRNLKGVTARLANQILQRTRQPFWQDESYDHWCRDEAEFQRVRGYIARNPVKAGLVAKPEQWPWSSAHRLGK